jgi:Phage derived protein Gp49-like (DUF891)
MFGHDVDPTIAFAIVAGWVSGRSTRPMRSPTGWRICVTPDPESADRVEAAVDVLSEYGPTLGRPLVDTLTGSKIANLKELRPRQTMIRLVRL